MRFHPQKTYFNPTLGLLERIYQHLPKLNFVYFNPTLGLLEQLTPRSALGRIFISIPHWDYWNHKNCIFKEIILTNFNPTLGLLEPRRTEKKLQSISNFNPTLGLLERLFLLELKNTKRYFNPTLGLLERLREKNKNSPTYDFNPTLGLLEHECLEKVVLNREISIPHWDCWNLSYPH